MEWRDYKPPKPFVLNARTESCSLPEAIDPHAIQFAVLEEVDLRSFDLTICAFPLNAQDATQSRFTITPDVQAALNHISADSLRGHLSFISSDLLQGRNTPSPGLDTAAEYIAAQFAALVWRRPATTAISKPLPG